MFYFRDEEERLWEDWLWKNWWKSERFGDLHNATGVIRNLARMRVLFQGMAPREYKRLAPR